MTPRWFKAFLAACLALFLVVMGPQGASPAAKAVGLVAQTSTAERAAPSDSSVIPITQQPFYPELLAVSQRWRDAPLSRVVGASPRETLLNFLCRHGSREP